ncbi:MAG: hypothetical protein M3Y59_23260 [Myxococcota bacterium]|nr:hypothetical protein [Myxococcota bacterium]
MNGQGSRKRLWWGPLAAVLGALVLYGMVALSDAQDDSLPPLSEVEPAPMASPPTLAIPPSAVVAPGPPVGLPPPAPPERLANPSRGQLEVRQLPFPLPPPSTFRPIDPIELRVDDPVVEGGRPALQRGRSSPRIASPAPDR